MAGRRKAVAKFFAVSRGGREKRRDASKADPVDGGFLGCETSPLVQPTGESRVRHGMG